MNSLGTGAYLLAPQKHVIRVGVTIIVLTRHRIERSFIRLVRKWLEEERRREMSSREVSLSLYLFFNINT